MPRGVPPRRSDAPTAPDGAPPDAGNAAGFVLPAALATLSLLALLAAAGFLLAWLELRMSRAHRVGVQVFYAADGALVSSVAGVSPAAGAGGAPGEGVPDSLAAAGRTLLRLRSGARLRIHEAGASRTFPGGGAGRRAVGRLALTLGPGRLPAALTTPNGAGGEAFISGFDAAPGGACPGAPAPPRAALAAPPPPDPGEEAHGAGTGLVLEGSPPRVDLEGGAIARATLLYAALRDGEAEALGARVATSPPWEAEAEEGEPPPLFRPAGSVVSGPGTGAGLLLASGDLRLEGPLEWEGLLLLGGALATSGEVRVRGAVVTGLEGGSGGGGGDGNVLEAETEVRFDGCALRRAVSALPLPESPRPGTWWERI